MPAYLFHLHKITRNKRFIAKAQNCKDTFCNDTFNLISSKETARTK